MTNQFIENLNAVCDKLGIAIDWTSDNLMPQIQDLLTRYGRYLLVANVTGSIFGAILVIFGAILLVKTELSFERGTWALSKEYQYLKCHSTLGYAGLSVSIMSLVLGLILLLSCVSGAISAATIPDIYAAQRLLEMIQQ